MHGHTYIRGIDSLIPELDCTERLVGPRAGLDVKEKLLPPPDSNPVPSSQEPRQYTDYAIQAFRVYLINVTNTKKPLINSKLN